MEKGIDQTVIDQLDSYKKNKERARAAGVNIKLVAKPVRVSQSDYAVYDYEVHMNRMVHPISIDLVFVARRDFARALEFFGGIILGLEFSKEFLKEDRS